MHKYHIKPVNNKAFASFVETSSGIISSIYDNSTELEVLEDEIILNNKSEDWTYSLFSKNKQGEWELTNSDDKLKVGLGDHNLILLTLATSDGTELYCDFKFTLTCIPESIQIVYEWIAKGVFSNATLGRDTRYSINIDDKYYNEIYVLDHGAYDDDPGEVSLMVCDIIDVDTDDEDAVFVTYRMSDIEVGKLTLYYNKD